MNSPDRDLCLNSPFPFNEKSTLDISHLSGIHSGLPFTPSPKGHLTDSLSPFRLTFTPSSNRRKETKSHTSLEAKLQNIETDTRNSVLPNISPVSPDNSLLAIQIEEEGWVSGRIQEIPRLAWCAYCKGEKMTKVEYVNDSKTFWSSVAIFLSGGFLGCFLLPYMTNQCKGVQVLCGSCGRIVRTN